MIRDTGENLMKLIYTVPSSSFLIHFVHFKDNEFRRLLFLWFWNTSALLPENIDPKSGQSGQILLVNLFVCRVPSEVVGGQYFIHNDRDTELKVCHVFQWTKKVITRVMFQL